MAVTQAGVGRRSGCAGHWGDGTGVGVGGRGVGTVVASPTALAAPAADTSSAASPAKGGWLGVLSCGDLTKAAVWVQHRITVIGGDATVKGSTAWVQAELTKAQAAGDTERVARLQKLLDFRAAHPDHWQHLLTRLQKVVEKKCS